MTKRAKILFGMGLGLIWALGVAVFATHFETHLGAFDLRAVSLALVPGGIVLMAMIGRLAAARFFDDAIIDGEVYAPGSRSDIDQRVLKNTVEQLVLAICLWPFVGQIMGAGYVIILGISFGITRLAFWIGYHLSPPLRAFGFASGFYATIIAMILSVLGFLAG